MGKDWSEMAWWVWAWEKIAEHILLSIKHLMQSVFPLGKRDQCVHSSAISGSDNFSALLSPAVRHCSVPPVRLQLSGAVVQLLCGSAPAAPSCSLLSVQAGVEIATQKPW